MRFILAPNELQQAVKDYLGKLVSVSSNTTMNVEVTKTTNGTEAVIDLVPATDSPVQAAQAPVPTARGRRAADKAVETPAVSSPKATEPSPESEMSQSVTEEVTEAPEPSNGEEIEPVTEPAAEEPAPKVEEPPKSAPRSLFANLRKPQNS